jgi:hypothetical protein
MNKKFKDYFGNLIVASFLLATAIILFNACEEVIDVDVDDYEQNIVIDGAITDIPGQNYVKIYYPDNAFKSGSITNISGAKVTVSDDAGNSEILEETQPGYYIISSLVGVYGRKYTLRVEYKGKAYTGSSVLMMPMSFDSIQFEKSSSYYWGIPVDYYKIRFLITNKKGIDEYWLIKVTGNSGNYSSDYVATEVYSDKYSDGKQDVLNNFSEEFSTNTKIKVELLSIDKSAYEYYYQLNELAGEGDITVSDILNMNTFNPNSNLSNGALGYFGAYSYKSYTVTVQ